MLKYIDKTDIFRALDSNLHGELKWPSPSIHLKTWQDMAVYEMIRNSQDLDIAEIGGGDSRILHKLAPINRCVNIDRFEGADGGPPKAIEIPGVRNILAYMGQTDALIPEDSYDVVYSVSVVEHVPEAMAEGFFTDMLRVLKPGGLAVHAIDLYIGSEVEAWSQARLDLYRDWVADSRVVSVGPITAEKAVFRADMASNPDLTMWNWNRISPTLTQQRTRWQSVSLLLACRKAE